MAFLCLTSLRLTFGIFATLLGITLFSPPASAQSASRDSPDFSIAFFYGAQPPLAELRAFDIAVVEPSFVSDPSRHRRPAAEGAHELFAYVSLGEIQPSHPAFRQTPQEAVRGSNPAWGSVALDQTSPRWREFFLSQIVAPLWEKGWRGFFIDTLDSYQLFTQTDAERLAQASAMVETLRELKRRYPQARLILNRGFELLPDVAPLTFAVAAESLYRGYDAATKSYREVGEADRAWLLGQLTSVRERYGLPAIAIDYVAPDNRNARELARETVRDIQKHGIIPWVSDGTLMSVGVGAIEVLPRNALVLVDTGGTASLDQTEAHRLLGMPLNYLGLRYEFIDLHREALPQHILSGRYAGIVSWLRVGKHYPGLAPWLHQQTASGMRVAVLQSFGFALNPANLTPLGLQAVGGMPTERLSIRSHDPALIGHETRPLPDWRLPPGLRLLKEGGRSLLRLEDQKGLTFDAAALTDWGGYVLAPFTIMQEPIGGTKRWVLQPIAFLKAALALPDVPVPDLTTEAGRRMLMVHVDGDGFASRAEIPGQPFAAQVMLQEFLQRYRIPSTVSVIEGEIGPKGLYPELSKQLEPIARTILSLPHVEGATHTYSHPFFWSRAIDRGGDAASADGNGSTNYHLEIPGYRFDLDRELRGSADYIVSRLMPPDKPVAVVLWTGDCEIPPAGLQAADRHGLLNMNGGDTLITEANNTWTRIAAHGIRKAGHYQTYAPNQNENVYTGNWTGPFYGYERAIETFRLTESPYRFKPVNIYYHTYSASKPASIAALHKVYRWAMAQPLTAVTASQYIRKALDFEATTLAIDLRSGNILVRTGPALRTLRLPATAAAPSPTASDGVAGIAPGPAGAYLTLAQGHARLVSATLQRGPFIVDGSGAISQLTRRQDGPQQELGFVMTTLGPSASFSLGGAAGCQVTVNGRTVTSSLTAVPSPGTTERRPEKDKQNARSPHFAASYYDLGPLQQNAASARHVALVRCPV